MLNKTHEKRKIKDILSLPRSLIRETQQKRVSEIKTMWKKTQYLANILVSRWPNGKEFVIGSNHLLDSLKNENENAEIWVEVIEVANEIEQNMAAEAHNYHVSMSQYETAKLYADEVKKFGEKYVLEKRHMTSDLLRKMLRMASIPREFEEFIPSAKSKATMEKPLTYSHWETIIRIFPEDQQIKQCRKMISETHKIGRPYTTDEIRNAAPILAEHPELEICKALDVFYERNKMKSLILGPDSEEKYETIERLIPLLNPQPRVAYDVGAQELYRYDEKRKVETEILRLERFSYIKNIKLIGMEIENAGTKTIENVKDHPKIEVVNNSNSEFHNYLIDMDVSMEPCVFIIDFSGLGISPSAMSILFKKRPNAHVIMTVVNLFDKRYNKAWVARFLCDLGIDKKPKTFEEYLKNVFIPRYRRIATGELIKMKSGCLMIANLVKAKGARGQISFS